MKVITSFSSIDTNRDGKLLLRGREDRSFFSDLVSIELHSLKSLVRHADAHAFGEGRGHREETSAK